MKRIIEFIQGKVIPWLKALLEKVLMWIKAFIAGVVEDWTGNPQERTLYSLMSAGMTNVSVVTAAQGDTIIADLAAIQEDIGDPSARTNDDSLQTMIGVPDAANSTLDDMLRTGYDSSGAANNADGSVLERLQHVDVELEMLLPGLHNHHLSPQALGEGVANPMLAVTTDAEDETNGPATTQWYYGEPYALIAKDQIDIPFQYMALNVDADTANIIFQINTYFGTPALTSAKNGGNAWDEGATVLTVADGSLFQTDDLVAIYSDYKIEIQKVVSSITNVVTVVRETSQFGAPNTGLRWNHTTSDPGTEEMTLIDRPLDHDTHGMVFHYSAASSKAFTHIPFPVIALYPPNTFVIVRAINMTNNTNAVGFALSTAYED